LVEEAQVIIKLKSAALFTAAVGALAVVAGDAGAAVIHRYSFNDTSATLTDSVGGATFDGTAVGGATQSGGVISFINNGASSTGGQHATLSGNRLLPTAGSFTIETFFTAATPAQAPVGAPVNWERVFDLGTSNTNYIFFTPRSGATDTRGGLKGAAVVESTVARAGLLNDGTQHYVAIVVDDAANTISMIVDNNSPVTVATAQDASSITGTTGFLNYLGRAQFGSDALFNGSINELRIHNDALSASNAETNRLAGPDGAVVPEPATASLAGLAGLLAMSRRRRSSR
jgi:hypothetical protein